jgi:hypothetical protein
LLRSALNTSPTAWLAAVVSARGAPRGGPGLGQTRLDQTRRARHPHRLRRVGSGQLRQGRGLGAHRASVSVECRRIAAVEVGARHGQLHLIGGVDDQKALLRRPERPVVVAPGAHPGHRPGHKQDSGQHQQQQQHQ